MRGLLIVSSILIMVFFQNCGSGSHEELPSVEAAAEASGKTPMDKLETPKSITVNPSLNPIEIDLQTGEVTVNSPRSPLVGKCLQETELAFLNQVLKDPEICEIYNKIPEGTNCSFALIPAYAHLKSSDGQSVMELGAANNGCREYSMDLCESSETLQAWVNALDQESQFEDCP